MRTTALLTALAVLATATPAAAHSTHGVAGGFVSGILHPLMGPDHLLAMVAVGLWGAQLGRPLVVVLPLVFPLVMAFGGVLGLTGTPLPAVEIGIATSALVLGLAVAFALRAPVWLAALVVAAFAIFHGHAHGQELPSAASPIAYAIGFMICTGLLHVAGIAIGLLNDWRDTGPRIVRACGGIVAIAGAVFLAGALSAG